MIKLFFFTFFVHVPLFLFSSPLFSYLLFTTVSWFFEDLALGSAVYDYNPDAFLSFHTPRPPALLIADAPCHLISLYASSLLSEELFVVYDGSQSVLYVGSCCTATAVLSLFRLIPLGLTMPLFHPLPMGRDLRPSDLKKLVNCITSFLN